MESSGERDGRSGKPSARAIAHVLDNARFWAPPGAILTPDTRLADVAASLLDHWGSLLVGAGLDEFVSFEVDRAPETLEDVARAYDLWAAASAAAAELEAAPETTTPVLPPDFVDQLLALEREGEQPRIVGAEHGVWDRSSPFMAIWWCNPAADVAMVFRAVGGHHAAGELALIVRRAMSEPPASSLIERARWPIERAQGAALAAVGPAFVAHGSMVCVATRGERAAVAHVGDARALRLSRDHAEWLTRDDVIGGEGPHASLVTRAVGTREGFEIQVSELEREEGDVLLLCSRDVWLAHPAGELARLVALHGRDAPRAIVGALSASAPDRTAAVALVL